MEKGKVDMEQIRRYVRGELSSREMYALERQAEADPMLMDIIRGMEEAPLSAHTDNLADIRSRLATRTGNQATPPVRRLAPAGRWAIAASILAVLSVGTWWFMHEDTAPQRHEAQVAAAPVPPPNAEREVDTPSPEAIAEAEPPIPAAEAASEENQPEQPREERLAMAIPVPVDARTTSSAAESVAVVGYGAQRSLAAKATTEATAPPTNGALARRGEAIATRGLHAMAAGDRAVHDAAPQREIAHNPNDPMPKDGWEAYWKYVKNAVKTAPENEGSVDLTFRVADNGRPKDVVVVKTTNEKLNKFATLIVRDGPAWVPGKNGETKVTLTVAF